MTNLPQGYNPLHDYTAFSATWLIRSPLSQLSSALVLTSKRYIDPMHKVRGPAAQITTDFAPFPIAEHHFTSYMLSLMTASIEEIELYAERVTYPDKIRHVQERIVPGYLPRRAPVQ